MTPEGGYLCPATLAANIGISHPMLTRMEHDERYNPGVLTLYKLSSYFNVSLDDLIIKE